ncbi:MAG: glycine dehydrogenase (aminomethyl-transferring), partial [Chlorobi bacterium]|nr:glycine dehydrogenase (aminomethyl-transferring) [Chlorobiota bacterium]
MDFEITDKFAERHLGAQSNEIKEMLDEIGFKTGDDLMDNIIHKSIRLEKGLGLGDGISEYELLNELRQIASKNKIFKNYIGMGYYPTITPAAIQRYIFENPGWYTQYTPYQAEISQGRLEALLNYQTVISDLTALPLTNASLLDEATAAAEAMLMFYHSRKRDKKQANTFLVGDDVFPQTIDVLKTRSEPLGIELKISSPDKFELTDNVFGLLVQYPNQDGEIIDYTSLFEEAGEKNIFKVVAADIMSLILLKPPGEFGADCVVGSTQRFGVPIGFGGPHAGYFATKEDFKRQVPGRIIGISVDKYGNTAYRMALQTREQHIKREKATSNICTAQVLLAIMAGMYAVYHGKNGLIKIADRINKLTRLLVELLKDMEIVQENENYFDTIKLKLDSSERAEKVKALAESKGINLRYIDEIRIGISIGESTLLSDVIEIADIFRKIYGIDLIDQNDFNVKEYNELQASVKTDFSRKTDFLAHEVFNKYHSETELMRYIKRLENKDLSLTTSMIPLGSCTMKLNAASELMPVSWTEFSQLHPFAPEDQWQGYKELFDKLEDQLCKITGFSAVSFQPNSGAQGEYA